MIYLDTHAFAALHRKEFDRFSAAARNALELEGDIRISPMVVLEIGYLHEIKRVKAPADRVVEDLGGEIGLWVCDTPFLAVMRQAIQERWTRDPFDRVIVAQARLQKATLITLDTEIHKHYQYALA